jgi:hypothetical protein
MRSATLTLTVDFVQAIDAKNLAGHGRFNNGKTFDPISFTAYAPRLQDTIVPGVTLVAEGNIRAIKDAAGITSLSLNITQAMQVARVNALKFSIIKNTYKSDKNLICEGYKAYAHR